MADRVSDNGYTKIDDRVLDYIISGQLSKREMLVLLCIIRQTVGYQRRAARLTSTFISQATGLDSSHVRAVIRDFVASGIIERNGQQIALTERLFPSKRAKTARIPESDPKTGQNSPPRRAKTAHKERQEDLDLRSIPPCDVDQELWDSWVRERKRMRKPLTEEGYRRQIKFLADQPNPSAVIEQSLRNGWTGLFPVRHNAAHGFEQPADTLARIRANAEDAVRREDAPSNVTPLGRTVRGIRR